jgi:hypothetical protein
MIIIFIIIPILIHVAILVALGFNSPKFWKVWGTISLLAIIYSGISLSGCGNNGWESVGCAYGYGFLLPVMFTYIATVIGTMVSLIRTVISPLEKGEKTRLFIARLAFFLLIIIVPVYVKFFM